ncbi:MAG: hypothetical protein M1819_007092 [Sarea resinae]|nr:MAG: hypothetical protein M1819_007092 [Sarea resinae]
MASFSPLSQLRTVTHRISTTPAKQLPQTLPHLLSTLAACKTILSSPDSHVATREASDSAVLVHKFKTQITSLVQSRTVEGRWAGVALVKSIVELGGWEVLRTCDPWVRAMIGILGRPDPSTTKKFCVITLTRIFLLTHSYQTLVREITTPSLPAFITACLNLVSLKSSSAGPRQPNIQNPLLCLVLDAFCNLLPRHPTTFRPFATQIHALVLPLIAPTPCSIGENGLFVSPQTSDTARKLFVLVHHCAAKDASGEEWAKAFRTTISNIHHTTDQVFRAVIEDWESVAGAPPTPGPDHTKFNQVVSDGGVDIMSLPQWSGIDAGIERLRGLLELLRQFLVMPTASAITLPVGLLTDLLTRIFSLTVPNSRDVNDWQGSVRLNPEIERDEREGLWAGLPQLHISGLEIVLSLVHRLGVAFVPLAFGILDQICWVFRAESSSVDIRTATYTVVTSILALIGPSLSKPSLSPLKKIITSCCADLLPSTQSVVPTTSSSASSKKQKAQASTSNANADAYLPASHAAAATTNLSPCLPGLHAAATTLLPHVLTYIPPRLLPSPLRAQLDRTAILTRHHAAMLASVLNPAPSKKGAKITSSILPLLARASRPDSLEMEALLRPRMPVLLTGLADDDDEEEEEEEQGEENNNPEEHDAAEDIQMETTSSMPSSAFPSTKRTASASFLSVSASNAVSPAPTTLTTGAQPNKRARLSGLAEEESPSASPSNLSSSREHTDVYREGETVSSYEMRAATTTAATTTTSTLTTAPSATTATNTRTQQPSPTRAAATAAADNDNNDDDDDDDAFSIPELVVDADTTDDESDSSPDDGEA